jgi:hypothetical protein
VLGIALVLFGAWQAQRVLPVAGLPTQPPFVIAGLPPDEGLHTTNSGYIIAVTLTIKSCSNPVQGDITLVLPREYYHAETAADVIPPLSRPLVGVAVTDSDAQFSYVLPPDWRYNQAQARYRHWTTDFSNPTIVDATGQAAAVRMDDWRSKPDEVEAQFSAPWLSQRGYGTCWLHLPRLVGRM